MRTWPNADPLRRLTNELPISPGDFEWPPKPDANDEAQLMDIEAQRIVRVTAAAPPGAAATPAAQSPVQQPDERRVQEQPHAHNKDAIARARAAWRTRWIAPAPIAIVLLAALAGIEGTIILRTRALGVQRDAEGSAAPITKTSTTPTAIDAAVVATSELGSTGTATTPATAVLQVRSDPAGAAVFIDGRRRGTAPVAVSGLTTGRHEVRVVGDSVSITQAISLQPEDRLSLLVPLVRPPAPGWIEIETPFDVEIQEKGTLLGTSAQRRLQLTAGDHNLELVSNTVGYRTTQKVSIRPGQVAVVRPTLPTNVIHVNATPWAEVWIDGRRAGETPLANIAVPLGPHEIVFRHPTYAEQTRRIVVTAREPVRLGVDLAP